MRASIFTIREVVFDPKKQVEFPLARTRDLSKQWTEPMPAPSTEVVDSSIEESESRGANDDNKSADTWGNDDERIVRHHLDKRRCLYFPSHEDCLVDPDKLLFRRTTIAYGNDGEEIVHEDVWNQGSHEAPESFPEEWKGRTVFYAADDHVIEGGGLCGHANPTEDMRSVRNQPCGWRKSLWNS